MSNQSKVSKIQWIIPSSGIPRLDKKPNTSTILRRFKRVCQVVPVRLPAGTDWECDSTMSVDPDCAINHVRLPNGLPFSGEAL
jgi:hypothetical protein